MKVSRLALRLYLGSVVALMGAFPAACADNIGCDPDQDYDHHYCVPRAAGGSPSQGSGGDTASAGAAGGPGFGTVCRTSTECTDPAPFCAAPPGQAGICTVLGCKSNPDVCPEDYACEEPVAGYDLCIPQ
jgi:hypothetical protein